MIIEDLQEALRFYFNEDAELVGTEKLKLADQMEEIAKDARYTQVADGTVNGARIYYSLDWMELFEASHRATPVIMGFAVLAVAVIFLLYMVTLRMLGKEVCEQAKVLRIILTNKNFSYIFISLSLLK